jgi:hypothetical protein
MLVLFVTFEEDTRELSSEVSLPHSGILRWYKIDFVDYK